MVKEGKSDFKDDTKIKWCFISIYCYFHIQKDKIEIILSSVFSLTVGVSLFHTGQILHSYWFILAPMRRRNSHSPTSRSTPNSDTESKITTVKRNNDSLQIKELCYNDRSRKSSVRYGNTMDVDFTRALIEIKLWHTLLSKRGILQQQALIHLVLYRFF